MAAGRGVLPGFRVTLGVTVAWLTLIVLVPLAGLVVKTSALGWHQLADAVWSERAVAAYKVSFGASAMAALIDAALGLLVAWVLARYRFPGKAIVDTLVDLPLALPTAVAGIALTALYAPNGWIGRHFTGKIAFAWPGIVIALAFVGLPFAVRTVQPVLLELDPAAEEASAVLGAGRLRTFLLVILPQLAPSVVTGFALSLARALGEYGSIVFVSGNLPMQTEIAPVLIVAKLEQYDYAGATAIALVLLAASFGLLLVLNLMNLYFRRWSAR